MWYYNSKKNDNLVIEKLDELAESLPNRGFDTYYGRLRESGYNWNRKRVLRVYRKMKLTMRRKRKKRLPSRVREPLIIPQRLNETLSMDFMCDTLENGRRFRILNVIDDYNREALIVQPQLIFPAEFVINALNDLVFYRGKPAQIRVDNGPEFLSKAFVSWCKENDVRILYIQPGKPVQNALIERFNRLYREDVLDAYIFEDIHQVCTISKQWQEDYNNNHPHGSLNGKSPIQYAKMKNKEAFIK
jgi:putative transposase